MSRSVNPHPEPDRDPQPGRASPGAEPGRDGSSPPSLAELDREVRQLSVQTSDAAVEVVAFERVVAVAAGQTRGKRKTWRFRRKWSPRPASLATNSM